MTDTLTPSQPRCRVLGDLFEFTFEEEALSVRVERFGSGDTITADFVLLSITSGGGREHLVRIRARALEPAGKRGIIDSFAAKVSEYPRPFWESLVELVAETVVERRRSGEPVVRLADVPDTEGLRWMLWPWLMFNMTAVFFGHGGSLKSWVAAWIAVQVAYGIDGAEPANVLIIDYDSNRSDWRDRIRMVAAGMGLEEPRNIFYRMGVSGLVNQVAEYQQIIVTNEIGLVIVDPAVAAAGGEAQGEEGVNRLFDALRDLRTTNLLVSHITNDKDSSRPFGSVFWWNRPRVIYQIRATPEPERDFADIAIINRKMNSGKLVKPFALHAAFTVAEDKRYTDGDSIVLSRTDIRNSPDLLRSASNADRVEAALADNGRLTIKAVAEATGLSYDVTKTTLRRLKDRGRVGQWGHEWGLIRHAD